MISIGESISEDQSTVGERTDDREMSVHDNNVFRVIDPETEIEIVDDKVAITGRESATVREDNNNDPSTADYNAIDIVNDELITVQVKFESEYSEEELFFQ